MRSIIIPQILIPFVVLSMRAVKSDHKPHTESRPITDDNVDVRGGPSRKYHYTNNNTDENAPLKYSIDVPNQGEEGAGAGEESSMKVQRPGWEVNGPNIDRREDLHKARLNPASFTQESAGSGCEEVDGEVMHQIQPMTETISKNTITILEVLQEIVDRQGHSQSRIKTYDSRLLALERKINYIMNVMSTKSKAISQAAKSFSGNVITLHYMQEVEVRNNGVLNYMNGKPELVVGASKDAFESLKEKLEKMSNYIHLANDNQVSKFNQLEHSIDSITQTFGLVYESANGRGDSPITPEELSDILEQFHESTALSIGSEFNSALDELHAWHMGQRSLNSVGTQWRSSLKSLVYVRQMLEHIYRELVAIKKQSKKGCKVTIDADIQRKLRMKERKRKKEYREQLAEEESRLPLQPNVGLSPGNTVLPDKPYLVQRNATDSA